MYIKILDRIEDFLLEAKEVDETIEIDDVLCFIWDLDKAEEVRIKLRLEDDGE